MAYIVTTETTLSEGAINNVDIPMPAGHQVGDMTVLMITQDGGGTNILNAGGQFTIIGTQGAAQGQRTIAYFRVHTATDEADVNFTGQNDEWIVTAVLLRGATTLSIDQNNRTNSANSTSNFLTSGSVTTSVDNCLILSAFGFDNSRKLGLDNASLNKSVNLSKEINVGCVQITQYFNQLTAGATDTLTALSEVQSEGGSALIVAVREATPSTAIMPPMITKAYDVIARYGGITSAATAAVAFIRHDGITWADANGTITPTTIGSLDLATIATFAEVTFQGGLSTWGSMTGLSHNGSATDATGRWFGRTHTVSLDMTGKIFTVEFTTSDVSNRLGPEGFLVYFEDNSGNWRAFQMSRRQGMVVGIAYVFFADVEQTTPYDESGTMDWSNVTRIAYLLHKRTTATNAVILRVKNALLLDKVIMVDGSSASPCSPAFLQSVLGGDNPTVGGHGAYLLATVQGKGQSLARFGIQYGNGTRKAFTDLSATSHELPLRADGSMAKRFWKTENNSDAGEYRIYASATDTYKANACVIATDTRQDFIIDAGSSASATYDFAGASIIGYDITNNVAGIVINGATLQNCQVTLNGGGLDTCNIGSPFNRVLTNNPENIVDTSFTSAGTGHAIEISAVGTFDFFGNTFTGYGADASTDAAIYNNSGGAVELVLQVGDPIPTIRNGAGASTTTTSPPVTIEATVLADSRVQLYNVTTDTELDNDFLAGTAYEFIVTTEASIGDTIRLRVCKLGYLPFEALAIYSAAGIGFLVNQVLDEVYTAYGIDGSTVTKFTPDYAETEIDLNVGSNFTAAEFYAWFNFNLTTASGVQDFFGGLTSIDVGNIRINTSVVNLFFDNLTTTNVFQNDNIRIFRADDAYPVINPTTGGGGIDLVWRNQVYTVSIGGSSLTPTESGWLSDINSRTSRVNGLIEDVSGDRFTAKALEEGGSGGGASLAEIEASTVLAKEATVSTRASQASVDAIPTNPLLTTDSRLDNLDAAISTRLSTAGYTVPPTVGAIATQVRTELSVEMSRIDAAITTRLATAGYTEAPTVNEIADQVWDELLTGHTIVGSTGEALSLSSSGSSTPAQIADQVRIELATELARIDTTISSRLATAGYTIPPTTTAVADQVRIELTTELAKLDETVSSRASQGSVFGLY